MDRDGPALELDRTGYVLEVEDPFGAFREASQRRETSGYEKKGPD